jgi:fluoride exporter
VTSTVPRRPGGGGTRRERAPAADGSHVAATVARGRDGYGPSGRCSRSVHRLSLVAAVGPLPWSVAMEFAITAPGLMTPTGTAIVAPGGDSSDGYQRSMAASSFGSMVSQLSRLAGLVRRRYPEPVDPDLVPRPPGPRPVWARPAILAAVASGGVLGACARYELGLVVSARPARFPLATFVINVSGSLVLGALLALIIERWRPSEYIRPFAATGFLGAYTTWSTFMVDSDDLLKAGHVAIAATYVIASLMAGLVAVYLGMTVVRTWPPFLRRPDREEEED